MGESRLRALAAMNGVKWPAVRPLPSGGIPLIRKDAHQVPVIMVPEVVVHADEKAGGVFLILKHPVHSLGSGMTVDEARKVAAAITSAADHLDSLAGSQIVVPDGLPSHPSPDGGT